MAKLGEGARLAITGLGSGSRKLFAKVAILAFVLAAAACALDQMESVSPATGPRLSREADIRARRDRAARVGTFITSASSS